MAMSMAVIGGMIAEKEDEAAKAAIERVALYVEAHFDLPDVVFGIRQQPFREDDGLDMWETFQKESTEAKKDG